MMGMIMSSTTEFTMAPNARPMITPTARSTTFPRIMNFLNSSHMCSSGPLPRGSFRRGSALQCMAANRRNTHDKKKRPQEARPEAVLGFVHKGIVLTAVSKVNLHLADRSSTHLLEND